MKKLAVIIILGLGVTGGAWWFLKPSAADQLTMAQNAPLTIINGTIEDVVTAQGKLEPKEYVDVGAQVSGQLEKLHVDIGYTVKTGDLIGEIEPTIYEAQVEADEARLKTLQAQKLEQDANVEQARNSLKRNEKLIKQKAVSQEAFEDAGTALKIAEAKLQSLNAQIEEAQSTLEGSKANLDYTKIYAPMDGTVVVLSAREGETLNNRQTTPAIVQIANLDIMTVRAQVVEADIIKLKQDMPIYFTTLGSKERKWEGTVRQILPSPETINDVVLYNVLVDVRNEDRQLMTGMSTQIFFVRGKADNVPVIPVSALGARLPKEDNEQGEAYKVQVKSGKGAAERIIHIGLMDRTSAEIKAGLQAGDQIIPPVKTPSSATAAPAGGGRGMRGMPRL